MLVYLSLAGQTMRKNKLGKSGDSGPLFVTAVGMSAAPIRSQQLHEN